MDFKKFRQMTDIIGLSSAEYDIRSAELWQIYDALDVKSMSSVQASALLKLYKMGRDDEAREIEEKRYS